MNKRLSAVIAISLVCAGLFVFNQSVKSDTTVTFNVTSGTDNTAGAQLALTATELAKLSVSDNSRIQTDGSWSMAGAYDETKYLEFVFTPNIPATASISSVAVTHEFYRSSAMAAAKLEIWDGVAWHDVSLTLPHTSGTAGEISETKDISDFISSPTILNGIKIRFLAYRNDVVQSGLKTSHDFIQLSVNYELSATPTPSATDSVLPTETVLPSDTATPLVTDASSSFTPLPADTPSFLPTPTPTPLSTPTPTFTPFISFTPDPETTPDPQDLTASMSLPLVASKALESPTPSPTTSPSVSPTPNITPTPAATNSPNPLIASLVKPRIYHRKATPTLSPSVLPSVQPVKLSRFIKVQTTLGNIWYGLTHWLHMIKR